MDKRPQKKRSSLWGALPDGEKAAINSLCDIMKRAVRSGHHEDASVDDCIDSFIVGPVDPGVKHDLAKRALNSVDDTKFFELLRIENGVITKQVKYPIYSEIEKTLARRTFDESGDYTVSPFKVSLDANTACTDNFIAVVEPGKAYVKGFEYESIGPQRIEGQKARTKQTSTDFDLSLEY